MSTKKKEEEPKEKICFVIMPISDQDGYDTGHFSRVYDHIVKPACEAAGFKAVRADDEKSTHYIVLDILKKIVQSEMVLCDLSSKNPNVMYELGVRQAFNKKVVLIKDIQTGRVFDTSGFRSEEYDESLRIDSVHKNVLAISNALRSTENLDDKDFNSLIQLLSIQPAQIPSEMKISQESTLILESLNSISKRIDNLEGKRKELSMESFEDSFRRRQVKNIPIEANGFKFAVGASIYDSKGEMMGTILGTNGANVFLKSDNSIIAIPTESPKYKEISPF